MEPKQDLGVISRQPVLEHIPEWEKYTWLRAGFSTRLGGRSQVYGNDEQNLGWTDQDDPELVVANRRAFVRTMGQGSDLEMVTIRQVHGAQIRLVDSEESPLMTPAGQARFEGDGMITGTSGRLLAILTADCVPVLMADTRSHAVGAFHAGWRGTLAHIAGEGVAAMQRNFGTQPTDIVAAIGPCIQACCFEVGPDVTEAFRQTHREVDQLFRTTYSGQITMDLAKANRQQLLESGVPEENVQVLKQCTACARTAQGSRRYFSYRAEQGKTGRMLSAIAAIA